MPSSTAPTATVAAMAMTAGTGTRPPCDARSVNASSKSNCDDSILDKMGALFRDLDPHENQNVDGSQSENHGNFGAPRPAGEGKHQNCSQHEQRTSDEGRLQQAGIA